MTDPTETEPPETDELTKTETPPTDEAATATEPSDELELEQSNETEESNEPRISNGMTEFSLEPLQDMLACQLCKGYFREPYTITKCLHTFCKSCLFFTIGRSHYNCPTCDTYLGKDVTKFSLPDRTMEYLIDKVLFPELVKEDDEQERQFYGKRGIALKHEFRDVYEDDDVDVDTNEEDEADEGQHKRHKESSSQGCVMFNLVPQACDPKFSLSMPPLERSHIETQARIRIGQLKTYIRQQLLSSSSSRGETADIDKTRIDILCNGVPLGNELSVQFILRTVWMDSSNPLTLTYQYVPS
jgi:polycomb group RING finger protein 3